MQDPGHLGDVSLISASIAGWQQAIEKAGTVGADERAGTDRLEMRAAAPNVFMRRSVPLYEMDKPGT